MRADILDGLGDYPIVRSAAAFALWEQQCAQDAVNALRAVHLTDAGAAQAGNDLRHFLFDAAVRRRVKRLFAAAERKDLLEKSARIRAVKMDPHGFRLAGGVKTVRLVAIDQRNLTAFRSKVLRGFKIHGARAHIGQEIVFMAFLTRYVAAVEEIISFIVIIVPDAGHIEKQAACSCRWRCEKTLGPRQYPCLICYLHTASPLILMIAQNMNKMNCFVIARNTFFLYAC